MAEYLIQEATLAGLGDKIRVLNGSEETMTPAQMITNVQTANTEVDSQTELISQIKSAVDGLPEAGSGGSGTSIETCTIQVDADDSYCVLGVRMENDLPLPIYYEEIFGLNSWEAPCGSVVVIGYELSNNFNGSNVTYLGEDDSFYVPSGVMAGGMYQRQHIFRIDAGRGETASIYMYEF